MRISTFFSRTASLLAVTLVSLGVSTGIAGALPAIQADDPGDAPQPGEISTQPAPEASDAPDYPAFPEPDSTVADQPLVSNPDHPLESSPLRVLLDVASDGPEATAHISVAQLQAEVGVDPQPVQVGLVWGDGTRALFDGGDLGHEITAHHRYDVDANEVFTVHAWVTDDQGLSSSTYRNINIEAEFDVNLDLATFQPWHHDCDGFWTGDGDFSFNYSLQWRDTNVSDTEDFDLGDDESTGVIDGGVTAEGVTSSDHPMLHVSWSEDDFGLDPALGFDISLEPRSDETQVETRYSTNDGCRIRLRYQVTTTPR